MNKTNSKNAKKAILISALLTLLVAGYEVFSSCQNYKPAMNLLDFASFANSDLTTYCWVLILTNLIFLPFAIHLYKRTGVSLKNEIFDKSTLGKDIALGAVLALVSGAVCLIQLIIMKGRTGLAFSGWGKLSTGEVILMIIALGFVSGIGKEIFFRGLAKNFCADTLGETKAFLLFNVMFALLDWHNLGHSFVLGLIWIFGYKKSNHLIVPMIAHGGVNIISILFHILTV